jgi:hypothetical protein
MSFFDSLSFPMRERARSPLYGSFILSWCLWNWRIFVALFFLEPAETYGYNVIEYINYNFINWCDTLIIPLFITAIILFGLPLLDYAIILFTEDWKRKRIDEKLKILNKHSVSGVVYNKLFEKFEKEQEKISKNEAEKAELAIKLNDCRENNDSLNDQVNTLTQTMSDLQGIISLLNTRHDLSQIFSGRWVLYSKEGDHPPEEHEIEITSTHYYLVKPDGTTDKLYELRMIDCDIANKKLSFVKCHPNSHEPFALCYLDIKSNELLEGSEGQRTVVRYKKHVLNSRVQGSSDSYNIF